MNLTTYKTAHQLQEEISKLKYELEILKQNRDKPTSVRFGTEYNVSAPIRFHSGAYVEFISLQMIRHEENIKLLEAKFNEL